ncbi:retrovirus-related pol polyprotein from transposon TNT 1-94 [Tanacetum coccineum]
MFKLDLESLAPRLLQNREAHIDYLKYTQEQANILWEIVDQAKVEQPLDKELDFALQKRLLSHPKTRSRMLGLKCSTSKNGSKPTGNKRSDRISQTPSRNMKNKVEAQLRKVNKKNRVVEPICDDNVKYSKLNANFDLNCATCKKSLFDDVHDKHFLDFVKNVNGRAKFTKKHKQQNIWKPTSHVFTEVGFKWKLTGKTFTIIGNLCPLTRTQSYVRRNAKDIPSSSSLIMTVGFENDHNARIMGYGDYQLGNVTISRVYYVEGIGHNLFSVGQFCDEDLEVAIWKNTCFIRNLEGVDLLFGSRKRKKSSHQPKAEDNNQEKLYLLHMDLCGPIRMASINEKRYILVIVDDYSKFTWVRFLRSKDEAPEAIINCIKNIQVRLNVTVRNVRTDNETEFVNQTLHEFYEMLASHIKHLLHALLSRTALWKGKTKLL